MKSYSALSVVGACILLSMCLTVDCQEIPADAVPEELVSEASPEPESNKADGFDYSKMFKLGKKLGQKERAAHIAVPLDLVSAQSQMQAAVGAQAQAEAFAAAEAKAQAKAQAKAKAEYDATMAKMQAMSDKLGHMAEDYEAQSVEAGKKADKYQARDQATVAAAAAAFPFLGLETDKPESKTKSKDALFETNVPQDPVQKALQHPEVNQLLETMDAEHKQIQKEMKTDPMAVLEHQQAEMKEEKKTRAMNQLRWNAIRDGWDGPAPKPDESTVRLDAIAVEANMEKKSGKKLTKQQKKMVYQATKVHLENEKKLEMTKQRLQAMTKQQEAEQLQHRKSLMVSQAETLYAKQDSMMAEVEDLKMSAKQAVADQKAAYAPSATAGLVSALQDVNAAVQEVRDSDKAVAELNEVPAAAH